MLDIPDGHAGAGNNRQADGSGETLVSLGIVILEADLELDGFEEVSLLGLKRVLEQLLDIASHSGCCTKPHKYSCLHRPKGRRRGFRTDCDFRHDDSLPVESMRF